MLKGGSWPLLCVSPFFLVSITSEYTKPMDISLPRSEMRAPCPAASLGSKNEKVRAEASQQRTCYKPYNPWIAFFQAANAAPPPYTQYTEWPKYDILSGSRQAHRRDMMVLAQQQMEQAAELLRKVGIFQDEYERQTCDQIDGTDIARQDPHEYVRKPQQDAPYCQGCVSNDFFLSQYSSGEPTTDSYMYTITHPNENTILRQPCAGNADFHSGSPLGDMYLLRLERAGISKQDRVKN